MRHPGQPQGHLSFGEYECGWWRGYKSPGDADLPKAAADAGLFGPAGAGGDYSQKLQKVLSNCPTCNGGTALVNPYTDAKAYFTGGLWPWVCSTSGGAAMKDYTGKVNLNCYCNNEPQNGRGEDLVFPYSSMFMYCGLYNDSIIDNITVTDSATDATRNASGASWSTNSKMLCDFITLVQNGTSPPTQAILSAANLVLRPATFFKSG